MGADEGKASAAIPVTILTGFLGSGKTTILNRLLHRPELQDTLAIINEFGEIGLDHLLVERSEETLVLLDNGCLCCTVRGDLVATLRDLAARREKGGIAPFRRIVVETTGLADPAPILHTLMAEPDLVPLYRLEGVITAIDAVNGEDTLDRHEEAARQAAVADRLLLTKGDLADEARIASLRQRLRQINRGAPIVAVRDGAVEPGTIFAAGLFDSSGTASRIESWLQAEAAAPAEHEHDHSHHDHSRHDHSRHDDRIRARCLVIEEPVGWADFSRWLELMAAMRGESLLRLKGIVAIAEEPDRPVVIHGVQHVFHPPLRLDAWPSADRRTRLVLITRDLPDALIESTLAKFAAIGRERIRMN